MSHKREQVMPVGEGKVTGEGAQIIEKSLTGGQFVMQAQIESGGEHQDGVTKKGE